MVKVYQLTPFWKVNCWCEITNSKFVTATLCCRWYCLMSTANWLFILPSEQVMKGNAQLTAPTVKECVLDSIALSRRKKGFALKTLMNVLLWEMQRPKVRIITISKWRMISHCIANRPFIVTTIEIAFEFCPFGASSFIRPDYKEACREVATGICEGAVGIQVNENGCNINDNNLLIVQNKCEGQVNSMTGGGTVSPICFPYQ